MFGPIKEKLGVVTRAFFAQANFGEIDILIDFHATLEAGLRSARVVRQKEIQSIKAGEATESEGSSSEAKSAEETYKQAAEEREHVMYMGTSIRELIYKWRFKTLMLLKLLLLQKKVSDYLSQINMMLTVSPLDYVLWIPSRATMHLSIQSDIACTRSTTVTARCWIAFNG